MRISRRDLVAGGAGIAATIGMRSPPARGQAKVTQAAAQYQPRPKGQQRCAICINFQPPHDCRFVEGPIAPDGWCQFFAARENAE